MENSKLVQALEQIASGEIVGGGDCKNTIKIMRRIATEAFEEVYEGKKEFVEPKVAKCNNCKK